MTFSRGSNSCGCMATPDIFSGSRKMLSGHVKFLPLRTLARAQRIAGSRRQRRHGRRRCLRRPRSRLRVFAHASRRTLKLGRLSRRVLPRVRARARVDITPLTSRARQAVHDQRASATVPGRCCRVPRSRQGHQRNARPKWYRPQPNCRS